MSKSTFNVDHQNQDLPSKITSGLERISEAFRVLLWEHAKHIGLSPIQIQILIFLKYHPESLRNVSALAKEFNLTKATISDAIKVLYRKGIIDKIPSAVDKRAYSIVLNANGQKVVRETEQFAHPIRHITQKMSKAEQTQLFYGISQLIYQLNQNGILTVQRTCYSCQHYKKIKGQHHCQLLNTKLKASEIRLDCPEFVKK